MKNRRLSLTGQNGFTVLEIMIAVMIFSVVISALFSSFRAFITTSDKIRSDLTHNEKIRSVLKRIHQDLESVFVVQKPRYKKPGFNTDPDPYRFVGKEEKQGDRTLSSITFASLAHAALGAEPRPGVARIGYYVKENKNQTYDLYRADSLFPFPEEVENCTDPVLCRDILGFEAVYLDSEGEEHKDWDSEAKEFDYASPSGIRLKIILDSEKGEQEYQTFVSLAAQRGPLE